MTWPNPGDFQDAIQNPQVCFQDRELKGGIVAATALGLPLVASGRFASVYKVQCSSTAWAVRCFNSQPRSDQEKRYSLLSTHLSSVSLPYIVGFEFQPQGILVRGNRYPVVKMEWIEGQALNLYVKKHLRRPADLLELAKKWRGLVGALRGNDLAHGDLQHGNVMVTPGEEPRLVDYDGMFVPVPALANTESPELGHPNYQHPRRTPRHYNERLDGFAGLCIFLSLRALVAHPELWQKCYSDENLIFSKKDFEDPAASPLFRFLLQSRDVAIQRLTHKFAECCRLTDPMAAPRLEDVLQSIPVHVLFPAVPGGPSPLPPGKGTASLPGRVSPSPLPSASSSGRGAVPSLGRASRGAVSQPASSSPPRPLPTAPPTTLGAPTAASYASRPSAAIAYRWLGAGFGVIVGIILAWLLSAGISYVPYAGGVYIAWGHGPIAWGRDLGCVAGFIAGIAVPIWSVREEVDAEGLLTAVGAAIFLCLIGIVVGPLGGMVVGMLVALVVAGILPVLIGVTMGVAGGAFLGLVVEQLTQKDEEIAAGGVLGGIAGGIIAIVAWATGNRILANMVFVPAYVWAGYGVGKVIEDFLPQPGKSLVRWAGLCFGVFCVSLFVHPAVAGLIGTVGLLTGIGLAVHGRKWPHALGGAACCALAALAAWLGPMLLNAITVHRTNQQREQPVTKEPASSSPQSTVPTPEVAPGLQERTGGDTPHLGGSRGPRAPSPVAPQVPRQEVNPDQERPTQRNQGHSGLVVPPPQPPSRDANPERAAVVVSPATQPMAESVQLAWDTPGWGDGSDLPTGHPIRTLCSIVRSQRLAGKRAVIGAAIGPAAESSQAKAYRNYVDDMESIITDALAKGRTSAGKQRLKQTIEGNAYDRISVYTEQVMVTVLIRHQQGRSVAYWYVGPIAGWEHFTTILGKAKVVAIQR